MKRDIARFLAYCNALGRAERTVGTYRDRLDRFRLFASEHGIVRTADILTETVRGYHDALRRRGMKASSRLAFLSTIRTFLTWAFESDRLPTDVAVRIELPRPEHRLPPRPLTRQDMRDLLAAFPVRDRACRRTRAILEVLYACGLRRAELLALNVGDIDFADGTVFVRSGKGNKDRVVPIHRAAVRAVRAWLAGRRRKPARGAPLFATVSESGRRARRLQPGSLAGIFRTVNKRFHKHVYPHLVRHTYAVHLLQGGAGLRHVQALLGHESPNTTSRYLGLVKDDIKKAYDKATGIVLRGRLAGDEGSDAGRRERAAPV